MALAPMTAEWVTRRRRWSQLSVDRDAVEAAWGDILDAMIDVEIPAPQTDTPRDIAGRLPQRCRLSNGGKR